MWLLGDDDTIIVDSLVKIVNMLDVPEEYGLLHIHQKCNCDVVYVQDSNIMIEQVSYYITFISANIVNAKYISSIDFKK